MWMKFPASAPPVPPFVKKIRRGIPCSTVATATEIYDYLRLLFARIGTTVCYQCGQIVLRDHVDAVADKVLALEPGRRFYVLFQVNPAAPVEVKAPEGTEPGTDPPAKPGAKKRPSKAKSKKAAAVDDANPAPLATGPAPPGEDLKPRLFALRQRGFNRLYQNGRVFEFSTPESLLDVDFAQPVYILVDRLVIGPDICQRVIDSVELCYRESGEAILEFVTPDAKAPAERWTFSERFECKTCKILYHDPEPSLFSFNNPFGACPRCQGFGNTVDFDLDLVIPDKNKSLAEGAIEPWTKPRYKVNLNELRKAARAKKIPVDVPFHKLSEEQRRWVVEGDSEFGGVRGFFNYLERKKYKLHVRVFLSRYRGYTLCPDCHGGRIAPRGTQHSGAGQDHHRSLPPLDSRSLPLLQ